MRELEKKFKVKDLQYKSFHLYKCNNNFIILDDKTSKINKKIKQIFKLIRNYGYNLKIIDSKKYASKIIKIIKNENLEFNTVILVGTGGKQMFKSIKDNSVFKNKEIYFIKWSREWKKDKSLGFETDLNKYNLKDKKIIIIEDVIASGNTLWTLKKYIEKLYGDVIGILSILIQESSPIINKSFSPTYSVIMINKSRDDGLDPFWYPPIYSLRHLLYGDDEMPFIYKLLNEKYFNNESIVEKEIKKIRKEN